MRESPEMNPSTNSLSIIRDLAATTSRNEKEGIVSKAWLDGERDFFTLAKLAYDVLVTFGQAKIPEILETSDEEGSFSFDDFLKLADSLANRRLTGHAARDAVADGAQTCHVDTWNLVYRRVLLKDLNVGITDGTINRALKKLLAKHPNAADAMVPVFDCQLAHNGDLPEHQKHMTGKKLCDVKLDGVRVLAVLDKDKNVVSLHMRDGKPNFAFPHLVSAMTPLLNHIPASIVLDGEIVMETFQELMVHIRKSGADTSAAKFALFDIIPLNDFRSGQCKIPQLERHAVLSAMETSGLFSHVTSSCLYVIPKQMVDLDTQEGRDTLAELNRAALANDLEGVMIKNPSAPYDCKRSVNWLKKKPKISVSLEIIGFEVGDPNGKNKNRLGALVCSGVDDGKTIMVSCGGGFTDAQRIEFWHNQSNLLGMIVEVEGDKLTLNDDGGNVWSIRFPVFKGFRGTVAGEKL